MRALLSDAQGSEQLGPSSDGGRGSPITNGGVDVHDVDGWEAYDGASSATTPARAADRVLSRMVVKGLS